MVKQILRRLLSPLLVVSLLLPMAGKATNVFGQAVRAQSELVHKVTSSSDRIEMTVNTSRRLTLDQEIPEAQVNNPEIAELTPLAPNTVQILAKMPGVTQVNLWGEDGTIYTVDVIVYGDAQELDMLLKAQFPNASLKVIPVATGVLISGYIDDPLQAELAIRIAEEHYPKVLNNITISGVQQVLLQVKVIEVSRTKLRSLGVDFTQIASNASFVTGGAIGTAANMAFGVSDDAVGLRAVIEALREDKLAKIMAEPNLVAISGRPSFFSVGGEFGYIKSTDRVNGTSSVAFKDYGTRVDFVAIVLGNGRIRLEVRPSVSEIDEANSTPTAPALK
ncbi:MAG TPA: pilus assembly protein N-terminal domain-containing protein, partial [Thermoguttaceae bacterium]|nr:pilus assembly protein N-terminal domain-containing protein [Thermoguttaceae bacterium]